MICLVETSYTFCNDTHTTHQTHTTHHLHRQQYMLNRLRLLKRTPVSAYRMLSSLTNKRIVYVSSRRTPFEKYHLPEHCAIGEKFVLTPFRLKYQALKGPAKEAIVVCSEPKKQAIIST